MNIEYWGVGKTVPSPLAMSIPEISSHLLADWVPSLPVSVSSSFIGWPPFLLEPVELNELDYIALSEGAGWSERQWKSVLSWMLGVAGTRHVLADEGYRWIAPVSAFFSNLKQAVDISAWHTSFPQGVVVADGDPNSSARLRPDYLALRPICSGSSLEWAAVEAKGTDDCLTNQEKCPEAWRNQVRNIQIMVNGHNIPIPRHLVVATRVNPNAKRLTTRRLQVRAWNSEQRPSDPFIPDSAVADIVSAHLFGIFRNLRLYETAKALASSVKLRNAQPSSKKEARKKQGLLLIAAENELKQLFEAESIETNTMSAGTRKIDTDYGTISIKIEQATMSLTKALMSLDDRQEIQRIISETDKALNEIEVSRKDAINNENSVFLSCGINLTYPADIIKANLLKRNKDNA